MHFELETKLNKLQQIQFEDILVHERKFFYNKRKVGNVYTELSMTRLVHQRWLTISVNMRGIQSTLNGKSISTDRTYQGCRKIKRHLNNFRYEWNISWNIESSHVSLFISLETINVLPKPLTSFLSLVEQVFSSSPVFREETFLKTFPHFNRIKKTFKRSLVSGYLPFRFLNNFQSDGKLAKLRDFSSSVSSVSLLSNDKLIAFANLALLTDLASN